MLTEKTSMPSEKSSQPGPARPEHIKPEVPDLKAILGPTTQPATSGRKPLFRS